MNRIMCGKRNCALQLKFLFHSTSNCSKADHVQLALTFSERALVVGLALGKDGLDEDAHVALRRVSAAHHAEPEALLARALLESDRVKAELVRGGRTGRPRSAATTAAGEAPP